MIVLRQLMNTAKKIGVGDIIPQIALEGFEDTFSAKAQSVKDNYVTFMFDQSIGTMSMNDTNTNVGGFEASKLNDYLQNVVKEAFPYYLKSSMVELTIPCYKQIFGKDYKSVLMKEYDYPRFEYLDDFRDILVISKYEDSKDKRIGRYWLRDRVPDNLKTTNFYVVNQLGFCTDYEAARTADVRPIFTLDMRRIGNE